MAFFTFFNDYRKTKLLKMADFSAKTQNGEKKYGSCPSVYLWNLEPVSICSIQNTARKNNYYSNNEKIQKWPKWLF